MLGYKDDPIFLLSTEEYKKYSNKISLISDDWWLRTKPEIYPVNTVYYVSYKGALYDAYGEPHDTECMSIRPVIRTDMISNKESIKYIPGKDKIVYCGTTWDKLDENLYLSENQISTGMFDDKSNEYETSMVRKYLLDWYNERKTW